MTLTEIVFLVAAGFFAGFINTVAGGGSLITLPLLIFMGLPSAVANGSNRVAILLQNIFAVQGFRSKGVHVFPYAWWVALSAMGGAIIGAYIATDISNQLFNRILAVIMIMVVVMTVFKSYLVSSSVEEKFNKKRNALSIILFFGVGIYGGFIQAGIGFIMIAILTGVHGLSLARTNSIKVFTVLCYTVFALLIFIIEDKVRWDYGATLAIGNATGGWIASRWSAGVDEKWVKLFLLVTVIGLAIKLWFFPV